MIKLHNNYKKINSKFKYRYMTVTVGNLLMDIPLSLPISYKQEFDLEPKYWLVGTNYLLEEQWSIFNLET